MSIRRAFVLGSNGPSGLDPLQFAQVDAEEFAAALTTQRCGFEVHLPKPGSDAFSVRHQLFQCIEGCTPDDTFICYFSGHGFLERGSLFLLWGNSDIDRLLTSTIPVAELLHALKLCRAENKLLILDCCHAGAVVNMAGLKSALEVPVQETEIAPENHLVLMASNRLERARELPELRGSFMTSAICGALGTHFDEADRDGDKRLSIEDLKRWLEFKAREHNEEHPDRPVPYPFLFGQKRGEFYFTQSSPQWSPFEIGSPDGSTFVVLPRRPRVSVICIAKYPVTNAQYRRFVESTDDGGIVEPEGAHWVVGVDGIGKWERPFFPWRSDAFQDDYLPVVCVSYDDALAYCEWVQNDLFRQNGPKVSLPTTQIWDFGAFGSDFPERKPSTWLSKSRSVHHRSSAPAQLDRTGDRTNPLGLSDMVGNVWEWCRGKIRFIDKTRPDDWDQETKERLRSVPEIRGGGFFDDLSQTEIFLSASELPQRTNTRHFDLGFRIAAEYEVHDLPESVAKLLHECKEYETVFFTQPIAQ